MHCEKYIFYIYRDQLLILAALVNEVKAILTKEKYGGCLHLTDKVLIINGRSQYIVRPLITIEISHGCTSVDNHQIASREISSKVIIPHHQIHLLHLPKLVLEALRNPGYLG